MILVVFPLESPSNTSMSNKRTRQLSLTHAAAVQQHLPQAKRRTRELTLGVDQSPPTGRSTPSRSRTLEVASLLDGKLKEKKVTALTLESAEGLKDLKKNAARRYLAEEDSEVTGSTSSEWEEERGAKKKRTLQRKRKRSLQKLVTSGMTQARPDQSLLEVASVSKRVRDSYDSKWEEIQEMAKEAKVNIDDEKAVDQMLVSLFNKKFLSGEGSHYGDYVMAALMDRKPMYGKYGDHRLPRSWRSLKGWRKLCPSRSRLAYPLAVWCAVSWRMVCNGHLSKAIFNLIQLSTYHRPGALLKLRKLGLVKPVAGVTGYWSIVTSLTETADVSKVGGKDDSVLLDSTWLQFIEPILERMSRGRKKDLVWDFDYGQYLQVFQQACEELRIDLVPYQARHSGPSIDRASKSRELEEVRKRGGWLTRQSVMRYEKAGRLAATWQKLDADLQMVRKAAEQHLEAIILGRPYPHISLPR